MWDNGNAVLKFYFYYRVSNSHPEYRKMIAIYKIFHSICKNCRNLGEYENFCRKKVQIWGNTRLTSWRNFEELGGKIVEKMTNVEIFGDFF